MAATTLFAISARIPIPLKETPTRSSDLLLNSEQAGPEKAPLQFPETLQERELSIPQVQEAVLAPALAYFIRAGSFEDITGARRRASDLTAELTDYGAIVTARLAPSATPERPLYWVLVGPFLAGKDADEVRAFLALQGIDTRLERLPKTGGLPLADAFPKPE